MPSAIEFEDFISARAQAVDVSGIRRVFELGAILNDPINFSIGQPHFPVPDALKQAAVRAIESNRNGYTLTQGIPELIESVSQHIAADVGWSLPSEEIGVIITSGTSGSLLLAFLAMLNPGDEVILSDPYFVQYPALAQVTGINVKYCDTYPDFRLTASRVEPLITNRTKMLLVNSPSNPSGVVLTSNELRELVELCDRRGVMIASDEIYDEFTYDDAREDGRCPSPARFSDRLILVRGFGKTYGCTGWRMGYAAGPRPILTQMQKLQQYTFVCAPSMAQVAMINAFDVDMSNEVESYRRKRDMVLEAFRGVAEIEHPGGAFYAFVKVPEHLSFSATEFAEVAVKKNVLIIPGSVFSRRDTHFRLSYAVTDDKLREGLNILRELMGKR